MPSNVKHQFVSGKSDDADPTLIRPSNWNDKHVGAIEVMDRDLVQVEVVNTTIETSIYSHSIPADQLGTTGGVRLVIYGDYLNNSGVNRDLTLRIKFGSTTILASGVTSIVNDAERREWKMEVVLMNSAASAQKCGAFMLISRPTSANFELGNTQTKDIYTGSGLGSSSEDTTGALTLSVTVEHGAAVSTLSIRKELAVLEEIPAA